MRGGMAAVIATASVMALVVGYLPFNASAQVSGEFWSYSMFTDFAGTNASGNITYTFMERTDLMLGGTRYSVNAVRLAGDLSGSSGTLIPIGVNATFSGTVYTSGDGMTLARDDRTFFTSTTTGLGPAQLVDNSQTQIISTYTPPYLRLFDPSKVKPGDSWTEATTVNTTTIDFENGTISGRDTHTEDVNLVVDVASTKEKVTTPAGTFQTLVVTVSRSSSDFTVYWWSSVVKNFVLLRGYTPGQGGAPVLTSSMTLTSFEGENVETLAIVIIGVVVVVIAIVIIVAILRTRARPRVPRPEPQTQRTQGSQ